MRYETVQIKNIVTDGARAGRFSFSFEPTVGDLADSITASGLVRPPLLRSEGTTFEVVCGFKRVLACKELGWSAIDALVCDAADISAERCLWLSLIDSDCPGRLSPVECAVALSKFAELGYDTEKLADAVAPGLGLPRSRGYVRDCLSLMSLEAEILRAIHSGSFGPDQAFCLLKLDPQEHLPIFHLLTRCRANLNETRELVSLIPDVAAMKELSVPAYAKSELNPIAGDESLPPRKRLERLRKHLRMTRYPRLMAAESAFESAIVEMNLDERCRIIAPRQFEGDEMTITLRASDFDGIEETLAALSASPSKQGLKKLFSIIRGEGIS